MTKNNERLEKDEQWFEENRKGLLAKHKGKWIVVHKRKCIGIYDSFGEAFSKGTEATGSEEILVREVTEKDEPMDLSINIALGLLDVPLYS